jgi:hypothetical protein
MYEQHLISKEDLLKREGGFFKFLELSDGTYRFWEVDLGAPNHDEMQKSTGLKAIAAGQLKMPFGKGGNVCMEDSYSSTLKLGIEGDGWERLEKYLGIKIYSRWED